MFTNMCLKNDRKNIIIGCLACIFAIISFSLEIFRRYIIYDENFSIMILLFETVMLFISGILWVNYYLRLFWGNSGTDHEISHND